MINYKIFTIIFIIFMVFIFIQLYYYLQLQQKNDNKIEKIEKFQNTLKHLDSLSTKEYILDDNSLNKLLEEYNTLKE
jgi:hypothetical protein